MSALLAISLNAFSQDDFLHTRYVLERLSSTPVGSNSSSIPALEIRHDPITSGDIFLTPHFQQSTFTLYKSGQVKESLYAKFDIKTNNFDVMTQQGIRVLSGDMVKSVVWIDSLAKVPHFLFNGKDFKFNSRPPLAGFLELLSQGSMPLMKKVDLEFIPANFNPALNVGSKDHKYIKKIVYYYIEKGEIKKLPKKHIPSIFGSKQTELEEFGKSLQLKKESELIKLFDYYNSTSAK